MNQDIDWDEPPPVWGGPDWEAPEDDFSEEDRVAASQEAVASELPARPPTQIYEEEAAPESKPRRKSKK